MIKTCQCGTVLKGRQRVQCAECYLKQHPGSSQCPCCFQWYMTHGGQSYASVRLLHATGKCKKDDALVS